MKKHYFRSAVAALLPLLLIAQPVEACTGFIIGKKLTADGSTLVGRTEDLEPNHNKNFVVRERVYNKKEPSLKMLPTVFNIPCQRLAISIQRSRMSPLIKGIFDEAGFNEYGVSISATVSASANDKIQKVDPYVKDGLAESGLTSIVLPSVKTAREGVELIAKIVEEKGAAEGNIVTIADKEGVWYMEILSGHQYAAILFPEDRFAVFQIPSS